MVYLLVTVQVNRGKLDEWSNVFEKEYLPLCNKHGQKLVAAWRTIVGTYDEVTDLFVFDSIEEFSRIRQAMRDDPEVQAAYKRIAPLSGYEVSKLMVAQSYSPMQ